MKTFSVFISLVLCAAWAQGESPPVFPLPPDPEFPVDPFLPFHPPCKQQWDCKNNCTKEKKALDLCCSNPGPMLTLARSNDPKDKCGMRCFVFKHSYERCLHVCKPKPKSCPKNLTLPKEFCDKICKHGSSNVPENEKCAYSMSMMSPLCKPYCQLDADCPGAEKCCETSCSRSCQKPE